MRPEHRYEREQKNRCTRSRGSRGIFKIKVVRCDPVTSSVMCSLAEAMIEIQSSQINSQHLERLHKCFVEEWGEIDSFTECKNGISLPAPILALKDGALVGGLSFTGYNKRLYLNALLVLPKNRHAGIASKLIRAAEKQARAIGAKELYALSDVPALYEKLDWQALNQTSKGTLLKRNLIT